MNVKRKPILSPFGNNNSSVLSPSAPDSDGKKNVLRATFEPVLTLPRSPRIPGQVSDCLRLRLGVRGM